MLRVIQSSIYSTLLGFGRIEGCAEHVYIFVIHTKYINLLKYWKSANINNMIKHINYRQTNKNTHPVKQILPQFSIL